MSAFYKRLSSTKIRLYALYSLIFFVSHLFLQCQPTGKTDIAIRWADQRATGLIIPSQFIETVPANSIKEIVSVRLANHQTAIAGNYQLTDDGLLFEPLIPFTRGLRYTVWLGGERLKELLIPTLGATDKPALLAIYPSHDSLPDNLLKIYLHFSRPMREGQSQKYVALVKNGVDTLPRVFLELTPELWNAERTLLTLWLDPGRIKRDLQPNKTLGAPLKAGNNYQIVVADAWPDQQGATLGKSTVKSFVTLSRDGQSPVPAHWKVNPPPAGSVQPLLVNFGERLDYSLLTETLHVLTEKGTVIAGVWKPLSEESHVQFTPAKNWTSGAYTLRIESRLEDLAGNNLNRPFDRDITKKTFPVSARPYVNLIFVVH